MTRYIIDASVVLSALIEKNHKAATALKTIIAAAEKKQLEIYTPSFMLLEVANGVRFSLPNNVSALLIYERLLKLPITYFSFNQDHIKNILTLSYELKTTVYDTSYHHLARLLDGMFLTCDRAYYLKAKTIGNIKLI